MPYLSAKTSPSPISLIFAAMALARLLVILTSDILYLATQICKGSLNSNKIKYELRIEEDDVRQVRSVVHQSLVLLLVQPEHNNRLFTVQ